MEIKILADRQGYLSAIEEAKQEWLLELLEALGVNMQEFSAMSIPLQVEHLLDIYKIEVITYPSLSALKVYMDETIVGEWAGPDFLLKTDKESGEKYYEITIETWTFMSEEIDM